MSGLGKKNNGLTGPEYLGLWGTKAYRDGCVALRETEIEVIKTHSGINEMLIQAKLTCLPVYRYQQTIQEPTFLSLPMNC